MGRWLALSSERVDEQFLSSLLGDYGTSWQTACHVTATASLARGIRSSGVVGMPIATFTDLVLLPGMPDFALPLDGFPGPAELAGEHPERYEQEMSRWQSSAKGRGFRQAIKFDDALRRYARTAAPDGSIRKLLVKSRREFWNTIQGLVSAGVTPQSLAAGDDVTRAAVDAWAWLEKEMPSVASPRTDLWIDTNDFRNQSTEHARELRVRVEQALNCAFGLSRGKRVIVHHGFYFYTPPQWALFQLLRCLPDIEQIFIVHDDGLNPAFETWRRFFIDQWKMPVPQKVQVTPAVRQERGGLTSGASALLNALYGERVVLGDAVGGVRVLECRNPAELVREWRREAITSDAEPTRRFAAAAKSVDRLVRRLDRSDSGPIDLAQLPIGDFLLAIHDCIKPGTGGRADVALSEDALVDIVASGFLDVSGLADPTSDYLSAIQSALPFFRGCVTGDQWLERAQQLNRLVIAEVAPLGEKDPASSDRDRIKLAVGNPLRLAPWADLSLVESGALVNIVTATVNLVEQIASQERIALKGHLHFLRSKLEQGMRQLADEERQEVAAKFDGFSVGLDEEIDVEGVVDVVAMLLGRTAEFDAPDDLESPSRSVNELRGLDALGLNRQAGNLHITNLGEGKFPSSVTTVGWPFRISDMVAPGASVAPITVEILSARTQHASLSDLYLLWLALDGVEQGYTITLSWMSEIDGEKCNPSPFLNLLVCPEASEEIQLRAGGLDIKKVEPAAEPGAAAEPPEVAPSSASDAELHQAVEKIDPRASASAVACARRLALQWILGQSASFQSEHHHSMLHGNIVGALMEMHAFTKENALQAANDLWRQLTAGQRLSSLSKSVVRPIGSAHGVWVLTLAGSGSGRGPVDGAYQLAVRNQQPEVDKVVPEGSYYLPPGVNDSNVCKHCPVRRSCSVAVNYSD